MGESHDIRRAFTGHDIWISGCRCTPRAETWKAGSRNHEAHPISSIESPAKANQSSEVPYIWIHPWSLSYISKTDKVKGGDSCETHRAYMGQSRERFRPSAELVI